MPEGAHPLPPPPQVVYDAIVGLEDDQLTRGKGWAGLPAVELNGINWTLPFAAKHLGIPEDLFRKAVAYAELEPSGVMNMRQYRSQGRTPRAYPAKALIRIAETLMSLKDHI